MQDLVANSICEFNYNTDKEITFSLYYKHYENISTRLSGMDRQKKVNVWKLGPVEYEKYVNYILPKKPVDITFKETILLSEKIFSDKSSLFNTCWNGLNLEKRSTKTI